MEALFNYEYRADDIQDFNLHSLAMDVLTSEGCPENTCVGITFVDDTTIHELNKKFRGVDRPTDVLSFECDGYDDDFDDAFDEAAAEEWGEAFEDEFALGDIFIAVDVAERQAQDFGTTLENEISLLMVHGLLHLIGYDHMVEEDAQEMEARETEILQAHGFIRQQVKG